MIDDDIDVPGEDLPGRLPLQREVDDAVLGGHRTEHPPLFRSADGQKWLLGPFNAMLYSPVVGHPLHEPGAALRLRTVK